jgi:hypothetical protein
MREIGWVLQDSAEAVASGKVAGIAETELLLTRFICKPLAYRYPRDVTVGLLGADKTRAN